MNDYTINTWNSFLLLVINSSNNPEAHQLSEEQKYELYELGKTILYSIPMAPYEYEEQISELTKRLNI